MTTTTEKPTHAQSPLLSISDEQRRQYREDGFFILERVIPPDTLTMLREVCASYIDRLHADMDAKGVDVIGISHRGKRYFISNRQAEETRLHPFIFGELLAEVCRATIGENAFLFHEQYVVKAAEKGLAFSWHQDSGYVPFPHSEYLSCWCALDDMSEENGTVYMLPYSRAGSRNTIEHIRQAGTNDLVGYAGEDPGVPVIVPAGSIAVFSSNCFHRSGDNTTARMRRSYLVQYSPEPIVRPGSTQPLYFAEPLIANGQLARK